MLLDLFKYLIVGLLSNALLHNLVNFITEKLLIIFYKVVLMWRDFRCFIC